MQKIGHGFLRIYIKHPGHIADNLHIEVDNQDFLAVITGKADCQVCSDEGFTYATFCAKYYYFLAI